MKKTLVTLLALVFVLGIAGTAFAAPANPFVDVPAKHWAYGAVAKLAKAGVVDGYGDGTFRGDRTMTRYEMAQVVAKAMAKSEKADAETKALIDKLAVEFAAELNNLGVRVAKLEKNASNIKFSGDARIRYVHIDKDANNPAFAERFRLVAQADVNDTTSFYFRSQVMAHQKMGAIQQNNSWILSDAMLSVKDLMPNISGKVGRYSIKLGDMGIFLDSTGGFDGAELTWKEGKSALSVGYADSSDLGNDVSFVTSKGKFADAKNVMYTQFNYKFDDAVKASVYYMRNQDQGISANNLVKVLGASAVWNMNKDWMLQTEYWKNDAEGIKYLNNDKAPKGFAAKLQYGVAKPAVPGTWQFHLEYLKSEAGAVDGNWYGPMIQVDNAKGWDVQYTTVLAKNVTFDAIYQFNLKHATEGDNYFTNDGSSYTRLQFNFMF